MNRKQRRIAQSKEHKMAITHRGKSYTIEEANILAIKEQNLGNFPMAAELQSLILAKFSDHPGVYNNRGATLQAMKRYEDALASYNKAIALKPDYAEAYYNRAAILKEMGQCNAALASYDDAIAFKPDLAEAYNNRGNILQELKQHENALVSYSKAVELKPDYLEAYYNRGNTLQDMKRYGNALLNYDKAIELNPSYTDAYNNRGNTLQAMKQYENALASFDKAIELNPRFAEAYNNRGSALHEMKRFDDALISCSKAIKLNPDYAEAYNNRGNTLQELKLYDDAMANYNKAIALKTDFPEPYSNSGATLQKMKLYDEAIASCNKAIALKPDYAEAYQNRGYTLVSKGDMQEAEKMFVKALALDPDFPNPLFSLSGIRKYKDANHADIKSIQTLLGKPTTSLRDREYLYFALGKIYDDCSLYDKAFEAYQQANQIRSASVAYNPVRVTAETNSIIDVFSKEFLAQPFTFASTSRSPLFIVGMPRSGTTLMANILSNHRSIATAGELPTITEFTWRLTPYPQEAQHIAPDITSRMISDYEKRLRRDVGSDIPRIIDKHPLNFRHLGLITMLFPKAQIIHCTRHPLDTGLSNYFQRFSSDYDYSFDLRNIGHFYREYTKAMEHWQKALPLKIIDIRYEDMIMNTEPMVRQTLDFLGLDWDERCLAPHTNPCAVETASNWQVRQPIYTQSLERWRHYEKHLTPLKEMLPQS